MNSEGQQSGDYRKVMAKQRGIPLFIDLNGTNAVEHLRNFADNKDIDISMCSYNSPDQSASRIYPLYFKITSNNGKLAREKTLGLCYYINEYYGIPKDCVEINYNCGSPVGNCAIHNYGNGYDNDYIAIKGQHSVTHISGVNSRDSKTNAKEGTAAVEIIIIPPIVFGSFPTSLMPAINYELARQMVKDGVKVDFDVYWQDYCMALPNSIRNGRYVVPVTVKELLNLDWAAIEELVRKPRPENSMIIPRRVPEAVDWFAEIHKQAEKQHKHQQELIEVMFRDGWQTPECIRYLLLKELGDNAGLEACRITARFFAAVKAHEDEIWHHIQTWAQRNAYKDYQKLKAIITFAIENPQFAGCEHKLLKRFCPAGKCFMAKLINEYKNPHLFEQV